MERSTDKLNHFLAENKSTILTKWFHRLLDIYPKETGRHLKNTNNQFANPMGHNISQGLAAIYDELLYQMNQDNLYQAIDRIVRIKAVQDVSAADACSFMYSLKEIIRESLNPEFKSDPEVLKELLRFESRIDQVVLFVFTIYLDCRETVYKLRVHEIKTKCDFLERMSSYTE
ncbi:MAG: RsbRD N-terminal domain-containing protein [Peptococcaceae bacterium]